MGNVDLDKYQQIASLIKDLDNIQWQNSQVAGTDDYRNWVPVINLLEDEETLTGVSESGYWVLKYDNHISFLSDDKYLRDLLPCLKKSLNELHIQIDEELKKKQIPITVKDTFPIKGLVLTGLKSKSEFWAALALNWLEHITIDNQIREQLQQIVKAKWASQKTRQKASKFLKGKIKQKAS